VLGCARDMNWEHLTVTVTRMEAGAEPPWKGSRRVSGRCYRFISQQLSGTALIQIVLLPGVDNL